MLSEITQVGKAKTHRILLLKKTESNKRTNKTNTHRHSRMVVTRGKGGRMEEKKVRGLNIR